MIKCQPIYRAGRIEIMYKNVLNNYLNNIKHFKLHKTYLCVVNKIKYCQVQISFHSNKFRITLQNRFSIYKSVF